MPDQDPFKQSQNPEPIPADPPTPASDPFADQLSLIQDGDGNPKYKDTSTALLALNSSQQHISTLEAERATDRAEIIQLREEVAKREAVEDVVARLSQPPQEAPPKVETPPNASALDADAVVNLIKQTFASNEQSTVAKNNRDSVLQQLAAKFGEGDALNQAVAKRAAELGTTPAKIGEMAEQTPDLVLQLFGDVKAVTNPTASSTNISLMNTPSDKPLAFEKSVTRGGFNATELKARMLEVKAEVYKEHGIE